MIVLAIAMLAMPLLVQPKEADGAVQVVVVGGIAAGAAVGTLLLNMWNNQWINCPAGCPNKVQRKNKDRDLQPCTQCGVPLWTCIGSDNRLCDVEGCKVDGGIVWTCPPRPDGVDMSTEHLHGDGICNKDDDNSSSNNSSSNNSSS